VETFGLNTARGNVSAAVPAGRFTGWLGAIDGRQTVPCTDSTGNI